MTFAEPIWFWSFLLFPFLLALLVANEHRREELLSKLVASRLRDRLAGTVSLVKRRVMWLLLFAGLAGIILTLARPQWGFTWEQSKRKGRDILLAVDVSRSMLADDIKPSRLARAKLAAQDLISELQGDRVGVIAFAGTSFLQAPLTVDYGAVLSSLKELDTEVIPQGGSNLEGALGAAREAFGKGESENRALIIFSDGEELDADAGKVAQELKGQVKVFTVGIGTGEGALIPLPGRRGGTEFVKDAEGNVVKTKLDESRLRAVAEATGGFYLRLQTGRAEMQQIFRDGLGKMTEKDIDARLSRRPIERYQWPLSFGLVCLTFAALINERKRNAAVRVAAIMVIGLWPSGAAAKNRGLEAYERKDYATAQDQFSRQLKLQPNLPALHYDLGAAAYKAGDLQGALEGFSRAVTSPDPSLRAKAAYNLGNTLFQRGAKEQQKESRVAEWKNAIQHYEESLKVDPKNADAVYNRDLVKKLLEQQEQQPPKEDEKKDQEKKDDNKEDKKDQQQKDEQDKQDQQKQQDQKDQQDQSKDGQDKKDQGGQPKDKDKQDEGKDPKDQEPQGGDQKDEKKQEPKEGKDGKGDPKSDGKDQQPPKNSEGQSGDQKEGDQSKGDQKPDPSKLPPPQPKKEGDLKGTPQAGQAGEGQESEAEAAAEAQAEAEGKMTPRQARALLDSLKSEDDKVRLNDPLERRATRRVLKDW